MSKEFKENTDCTTTGFWGIRAPNVSGDGKKVKQPIPIWPGTLVWLLVGAIYLIYKAFSWYHYAKEVKEKMLKTEHLRKIG